MNKLTCLGMCVFGVLATPSLWAAPPSVTSFFPQGIQQGATTELKLTGKIGTQPVSVMSPSSTLSDFKISEKGDSLTLTANKDAEPGVHWLRFFNKEGATSLLPILVGVLPERSENEPNNSANDSEKIEALPVLINGVLHKSGEVDTFAVTLADGETLIASVDSHEALASPADPVLQILNDQGFVIDQNDDDHGFDPLLTFKAPYSGTFLVRVFCFPATPNSTINFAGGSTYGYRLSLTSGPFIISKTAKTDQLLGYNIEGKAATKELTTSSPGLHHVHQELREMTPLAESKGTSQVLSAPFVVSGAIEKTGEVDAFKVAAKKGETWQLKVRARQIGSHLDPVLNILNSEGKSLKEVDDVSRSDQDINYAWKVPADGEYTLSVSDRFNHAGFRYVYALSSERNQPDVTMELSADHFEAKRDKALEIPVTINRLHGFKEVVEVRVEGLPEGVTAEAVKSEAKGDSSKKVTLKIDVKDAEEFQGSIQIEGVFGEKKEKVSATVPLKIKPLKTAKLWLTIPENPKEKTEPEEKKEAQK